MRRAALLMALALPWGAPPAASPGPVEQGRALAFARDKGNCLACHAIAGGTRPGNVGPPLEGMRERYPDRAALRAQIADATRNNPDSIMPPFGRHEILTPEEIDLVTDFIHSL